MAWIASQSRAQAWSHQCQDHERQAHDLRRIQDDGRSV